MRNETRVKVPQKWTDKIAFIEYDGVEREYEIMTEPGYVFGVNGAHFAFETSQAGVLSTIRSIEPCDCARCTDTDNDVHDTETDAYMGIELEQLASRRPVTPDSPDEIKPEWIPRAHIEVVRETNTDVPELAISSPHHAAQIVAKFLGNRLDREYFIQLSLNNKNYVQAVEIVSIGNINSAIVSPRDVLKASILTNSAAVILTHLHPSGIVEPSDEDLQFTRRMVEAGKLMDIFVLDHIVVGTDYGRTYHSMREKNTEVFV